jgi:iron-sulfur cluster assembly protein
MSIQITPTAATELKTIYDREVQEKRLTPAASLRVLVQGGGCSGFAYRMGFDEKQRPDDRMFDVGGVKVLVDWRSYIYLKGAVIDFQDGPMGRGFVFHNPNNTGSCGCGSAH